MIKYKSTRGGKLLYTFSRAVLKGIADDGGLLVPQKIPKLKIEQIKKLSNKSYKDIAKLILNLFQTDFTQNNLNSIINKAYSKNFDNSQIAPLVHLKNNQYIVELWHGPTSAFKDMALQIMPLFFSEAIKLNKTKHKYLILVATSGDTGKAALEGYKNLENISIIVFFPNKGVSKLQELQMTTQDGNNLEVFAMDGDFDAVQSAVKSVFNNKKFNDELKSKKIILSSANSINWGRLVPQTIYYVSSYVQLIIQNKIKPGDYIDVCVPTGNFGNILAAFYAKKMGLPIRKLICASNENNVLTDFLKTGIYDISKRKLIKTPSPSMDILIASNIERLLYEITNNVLKVSRWMNDLKNYKKFQVDDKTKNILNDLFYADFITNDECLKNIKDLYKETKYLIDPHTSVAQKVAERFLEKQKKSIPVIICATAHWSKFAKDIYKELISSTSQINDEFEILNMLQEYDSFIPENIDKLKNKVVIHKQKCGVDKKNIEEKIKKFTQFDIV